MEAPPLYTSYWSNPKLVGLDAVPVGISRGVPRRRLPFRYRMLRLLAPSREVFAIEDLDEFERQYRAGLDEIGVERIAGELRRISEEGGGRPLVLLCFEPPGEFCHRRVLAEWLRKRAGVEVPELKPKGGEVVEDKEMLTDRLDRLCTDLTGLCLKAGQLTREVPPEILELTDAASLVKVLEVAANIMEEVLAVALLDERLDRSVEDL